MLSELDRRRIENRKLAELNAPMRELEKLFGRKVTKEEVLAAVRELERIVESLK